MICCHFSFYDYRDELIRLGGLIRYGGLVRRGGSGQRDVFNLFFCPYVNSDHLPDVRKMMANLFTFRGSTFPRIALESNKNHSFKITIKNTPLPPKHFYYWGNQV